MEAGPSPADPERPQCHVMARRGWLNDPNGPVYHNGVYHLCASAQLPMHPEFEYFRRSVLSSRPEFKQRLRILCC